MAPDRLAGSRIHGLHPGGDENLGGTRDGRPVKAKDRLACRGIERTPLDVDPITNQVISRDRYAFVMNMLALICKSLSVAMGEEYRSLSSLVTGYAGVAMENIALWHERDISHSSTERVIFPNAFAITEEIIQEASNRGLFG